MARVYQGLLRRFSSGRLAAALVRPGLLRRLSLSATLVRCRRPAAEHGALLQDGERADIEAALARVRELAKGDDSHAIKEAIHALDEVSRPFVERVMNQAIRQVVAGHSVEEY